MTFAGWTLSQLAVVFGAGAAAITVLYLLRMRRRQVVVPFAALWERTLRDSESRRLWRQLRRFLSWLLQLGVLVLLCAALGDPRPDVWLRDPSTLAIVIDRSASMSGTTESGATRLDDARERAAAEIAALGPVDRALVIAAGEEVGVVAPLGSDPALLTPALADLQPTHGEADLARALALARHAVVDEPGGRILVLTDGALDSAGAAAVRACLDDGSDAPLPCQVASFGGSPDNLAITAFAARRYPNAPDKVEVLAEVRNLGDAPAAVELDVAADGVSVGRRRLELRPGEARRELLSDLDAARARFVATLETVADAPPGFTSTLGPAFDDVAYAVVPPLSPLDVVLVTDGNNLFLEAALLTQGEHVRLTGIGPDRARAGAAELAEADVVVLDVGAEELPATLPAAHVLVFDPWRHETSPCPIARKAEVRRPFLTEQARAHPLLADVVLKDVNIGRGTTFAIEPGDQPLVRTLGDPIMVLRERGDHALVAVGFDPRQSDLPLRTAFPVLVDNVLRYFGQREAGFVASVPLGAHRELVLADLGLPVENVERALVVMPGGEETTVPVERGRIRLRTLVPGFYGLETGGTRVEVAANQASLDASDLHDRIDADVPEALRAGEAPQPAPIAEGPLWTTIMLLAALVIAIEWASYHRRVTV